MARDISIQTYINRKGEERLGIQASEKIGRALARRERWAVDLLVSALGSHYGQSETDHRGDPVRLPRET